jgi:dolichyl-phosphate beta-glucosyltransferase
MYLSVIIPCYNEEQRLPKTLERIGSYLSSQTYQCEVIVVDNGSTDGTKRVVEEAHQKYPFISLINERSHGKGWAVKEGMLAGSGTYRLFTDADNSTDIAQIEKLLPYAKDEGYDVVISSRKAPGAVLTHPQPPHRVWLGNLFAFIVSLIVPLGVKDSQNGFKLFSERAVDKIFPQQTIFYWAFDVEVLALARVFGFKIKEVPITWVNDEQSRMNLKGMIRMLLEVIVIRLHLLTRNYRKNQKELISARLN